MYQTTSSMFIKTLYACAATSTNAGILALCDVTMDINDVTSEQQRQRSRTNFTNHQINELERVFSELHYPDVNTRDKLAQQLQIPEPKIQVIQTGFYKLVCACVCMHVYACVCVCVCVYVSALFMYTCITHVYI